MANILNHMNNPTVSGMVLDGDNMEVNLKNNKIPVNDEPPNNPNDTVVPSSVPTVPTTIPKRRNKTMRKKRGRRGRGRRGGLNREKIAKHNANVEKGKEIRKIREEARRNGDIKKVEELENEYKNLGIGNPFLLQQLARKMEAENQLEDHYDKDIKNTRNEMREEVAKMLGRTPSTKTSTKPPPRILRRPARSRGRGRSRGRAARARGRGRAARGRGRPSPRVLPIDNIPDNNVDNIQVNNVDNIQVNNVDNIPDNNVEPIPKNIEIVDLGVPTKQINSTTYKSIEEELDKLCCTYVESPDNSSWHTHILQMIKIKQEFQELLKDQTISSEMKNDIDRMHNKMYFFNANCIKDFRVVKDIANNKIDAIKNDNPTHVEFINKLYDALEKQYKQMTQLHNLINSTWEYCCVTNGKKTLYSHHKYVPLFYNDINGKKFTDLNIGDNILEGFLHTLQNFDGQNNVIKFSDNLPGNKKDLLNKIPIEVATVNKPYDWFELEQSVFEPRTNACIPFFRCYDEETQTVKFSRMDNGNLLKIPYYELLWIDLRWDGDMNTTSSNRVGILLSKTAYNVENKPIKSLGSMRTGTLIDIDETEIPNIYVKTEKKPDKLIELVKVIPAFDEYVYRGYISSEDRVYLFRNTPSKDVEWYFTAEPGKDQALISKSPDWKNALNTVPILMSQWNDGSMTVGKWYSGEQQGTELIFCAGCDADIGKEANGNRTSLNTTFELLKANIILDKKRTQKFFDDHNKNNTNDNEDEDDQTPLLNEQIQDPNGFNPIDEEDVGNLLDNLLNDATGASSVNDTEKNQGYQNKLKFKPTL